MSALVPWIEMAGVAHLGVIADRLGDDIARAGQRVVDGRNVVGEEALRGRFRAIAFARLGKDEIGERLQTALAGDAGTRAALGPVGLVEIFERGQRLGGEQFRLQFRRQFLLLTDGGQDRLTPFVQGAQ